MNRFDVALKRYYQEVRSWLPCSRRLKNQIMERLHESVDSYLEQNPTADFDQLQSHFGTPETIAAAYVDEMGTDVLLRDLRIRRKILSIVAGTMAAVLAIWLIAVGWAVVKELKSDTATFQVDGITIIEESE